MLWKVDTGLLWKEDLAHRVYPFPGTKDCYTLGSEWLSTKEPVHLVLLTLRTKVAVFLIRGTKARSMRIQQGKLLVR